MLSNIKTQELLIILFIILLLFGAKKLPEMARGLGRSVRILKSESKAAQEESESETAAEDKTEEKKD
jgi:sec-independent protein translocase protein TatA